MMTDLVQHLRESATDLCYPDGCCYADSMVKAADEIERLTQLCEDLKADRRCVARDMQVKIDALKAALTTTEGR